MMPDETQNEQVQYEAPTPPQTPSLPPQTEDMRPTPVVRVLSPTGVEYVFMIFSLFIAAFSLVGVLLSLVNGKTDFSVLAFPVAALVVSVPTFAFFFLHLKKMEANNPALRFDASKRRSTQFTQIAAFVVSMLTVIGFVFSVFAKLGGQSTLSIGKAALDCLCVLVVSGGILAYYWNDEHKTRRQG